MLSKKAIEDFRLKSFAHPHPALAHLGTSLTNVKGEAQQDTTRVILHFDVDAFYAQVEEVRNPALREVPLGVTQKYLLVTCNYVARAAGVTKLMGITEAQHKCPGLVLVSGEDLTPYRAASKSIISVLQRYGPAEKLGLDEVFVDVTKEVAGRLARGVAHFEWRGHVHGGGSQLQQDSRHRPQDLRISGKGDAAPSYQLMDGVPAWMQRLMVGSTVADEMRRVLKSETGFRSSAGIACNKMLAKMVSGLHKPDDQTILLPPEAYAFLAPLPVRSIPGIGYKTEAELTQKGISTVQELRDVDVGELKQQFGERTGPLLWSLCRGLDCSEVVPKGPPKSITVEDSFKNCSSWNGVRAVLCVLAPDLLGRMQEDAEGYNRRPATLTVKWRLRSNGWSRSSASVQLPSVLLSLFATTDQQVEALINGALALLHRHLQLPFNLSLLNLGVTNFKPATADSGATSILNFFGSLPQLGSSMAASGEGGVRKSTSPSSAPFSSTSAAAAAAKCISTIASQHSPESGDSPAAAGPVHCVTACSSRPAAMGLAEWSTAATSSPAAAAVAAGAAAVSIQAAPAVATPAAVAVSSQAAAVATLQAVDTAATITSPAQGAAAAAAARLSITHRRDYNSATAVSSTMSKRQERQLREAALMQKLQTTSHATRNIASHAASHSTSNVTSNATSNIRSNATRNANKAVSKNTGLVQLKQAGAREHTPTCCETTPEWLTSAKRAKLMYGPEGEAMNLSYNFFLECEQEQPCSPDALLHTGGVRAGGHAAGGWLDDTNKLLRSRPSIDLQTASGHGQHCKDGLATAVLQAGKFDCLQWAICTCDGNNVRCDVAAMGAADTVCDVAAMGAADAVCDMAGMRAADAVCDVAAMGDADVIHDVTAMGDADAMYGVAAMGAVDTVHADQGMYLYNRVLNGEGVDAIDCVLRPPTGDPLAGISFARTSNPYLAGMNAATSAAADLTAVTSAAVASTAAPSSAVTWTAVSSTAVPLNAVTSTVVPLTAVSSVVPQGTSAEALSSRVACSHVRYATLHANSMQVNMNLPPSSTCTGLDMDTQLGLGVLQYDVDMDDGAGDDSWLEDAEVDDDLLTCMSASDRTERWEIHSSEEAIQCKAGSCEESVPNTCACGQELAWETRTANMLTCRKERAVEPSSGVQIKARASGSGGVIAANGGSLAVQKDRQDSSVTRASSQDPQLGPNRQSSVQLGLHCQSKSQLGSGCQSTPQLGPNRQSNPQLGSNPKPGSNSQSNLGSNSESGPGTSLGTPTGSNFPSMSALPHMLNHSTLKTTWEPQPQQTTLQEPGSKSAASGAVLTRMSTCSSSDSRDKPADSNEHVVIHCDVDCFYCQVERMDDRSLIGKPVAVCQFNSGGFVAVSYEARAAGIRCGDGVGAGGRANITRLKEQGALSMEEAFKRCPGLVVKPMRTGRYREVGALIYHTLRRFAPTGEVEKTSYDDFYIDVTRACSRCIANEGGASILSHHCPVGVKVVGESKWEDVEPHLRKGVEVATQMRSALVAALGLTVSCGVAPSKLAARLVGPLHKPNGLSVLPLKVSEAFLRKQFLKDIPGLGQKAGREVVEALGVETVGDLAHFSAAELQARFGKATSEFLVQLAQGRDKRPVQDRGAQKSILSERSFPPMNNMEDIKTALRPLCETLVVRVAQDHQQTGRVPAKLTMTWRQGYGGSNSKTTSIPPQMKAMLKAVLNEVASHTEGTASGEASNNRPMVKKLTEKDVARTPACVNTWKFATNVLRAALQAQFPKGGLQVTRLAVAACYNPTAAVAAGPTIRSFWSAGMPTH